VETEQAPVDGDKAWVEVRVEAKGKVKVKGVDRVAVQAKVQVAVRVRVGGRVEWEAVVPARGQVVLAFVRAAARKWLIRRVFPAIR